MQSTALQTNIYQKKLFIEMPTMEIKCWTYLIISNYLTLIIQFVILLRSTCCALSDIIQPLCMKIQMFHLLQASQFFSKAQEIIHFLTQRIIIHTNTSTGISLGFRT